MIRSLTVAFVALVLASVSLDAFAQTPVGPKFQANTYTVGHQQNPVTAALGNGGFVVVWDSGANQDGSLTGIFGQRYAADGARVGREFRVNTQTQGNQDRPAVAALADGGFVVLWNDGLRRIAGQRYSSAGSRAGGEFVVSAEAGYFGAPSVAGLRSGGFVATWLRYVTPDPTGLWGAYAQRYSAAGARIGNAFLVEKNGTSDDNFQRYSGDPVAAALRDGGFILISNHHQYADDGYQTHWGEIHRYDAAGNLTAGGSTGIVQSAAALMDGGYVLVGRTIRNSKSSSAFTTRFGADNKIVRTSAGPRDTSGASVAGLSDGGFIRVWHYRSEHNGKRAGTYAQRHNAQGIAAGPEFGVHPYFTQTSTASLKNGRFLVVRPEPRDASHLSVFGRLFRLDK